MVRPFQNVEKWLENFKDVISLFNLRDLCKLILAKRYTTGKVKLPIQNKTKINSWDKLKTLLNSPELHELLSNRKMNDNESLDKYFLSIKQL